MLWISSGITEGVVTVLSRHTTCGITINEMEGRLVDDVRQWLIKLAPPEYPYLHNDLHLRSGPPGGYINHFEFNKKLSMCNHLHKVGQVEMKRGEHRNR